MKNLLKKLIATAPTCENGELQMARVLESFFRDHGVSTKLDYWDNKRANLIATIGPEGLDVQTLVIGVHNDVVPASAENWESDPFKAVEADGKIHGRGSCDMQGGICAAAQAIVEIAQSGKELNGRILFAATAGEETDSCGVERFVEQYSEKIHNPVGVLIPEPTGLEILRAHRGILWLKVETAGKTAHGSMPHLGINAIEKANAFLNRLKDYTIPHTPHALLGGCSMSINRIAGGTGTNIVPDNCSIELDIRTLPGQDKDTIIDSLQVICSELARQDPDFKAEISIIRAIDAMETDENDPFLQTVCNSTGIAETKAAVFTTDGPHFEKLNASVVVFGPGDGTLCHKPNEYIEIAQMEKAKEYYIKLINDVLTC